VIFRHLTHRLFRLPLLAVDSSQQEISLPGEWGLFLDFDYSIQGELGRGWIADYCRSSEGI
jgi:hypothetical protein